MKDVADEQIALAESFERNDFAVEVYETPPPEPVYDFFSHVYPKCSSIWGVIVGIRWDGAWYYQLDTDYDEWVSEDDIEVHVLRKG